MPARRSRKSASRILTMAITNLSSTNPLVITVFHGADFDVNGSAGTDNATLLTPNSNIAITDTTAGTAGYRGFGPPAEAFLVRPFAATTDVFGLLGDTGVSNFDNTGLPASSFELSSRLLSRFSIASVEAWMFATIRLTSG